MSSGGQDLRPSVVRPRVDATALGEDLGGSLLEIRTARDQLDRREVAAIQAARDRGWTWDEIAKVWGIGSRQASQQRYATLRRRMAT